MLKRNAEKEKLFKSTQSEANRLNKPMWFQFDEKRGWYVQPASKKKEK